MENAVGNTRYAISVGTGHSVLPALWVSRVLCWSRYETQRDVTLGKLDNAGIPRDSHSGNPQEYR